MQGVRIRLTGAITHGRQENLVYWRPAYVRETDSRGVVVREANIRASETWCGLTYLDAQETVSRGFMDEEQPLLGTVTVDDVDCMACIARRVDDPETKYIPGKGVWNLRLGRMSRP